MLQATRSIKTDAKRLGANGSPRAFTDLLGSGPSAHGSSERIVKEESPCDLKQTEWEQDISSHDGDEDLENYAEYDAFDNDMREKNSLADHLLASTGRERDEETGLQVYRTRHYDPIVGRFMSEDPIGFEAEDANLARYVENQTTRKVDPSGTFSMEGMYTEFFNRYGDDGLALLMLAVQKGYKIDKRGYWSHDWYIEENSRTIGIKASNLGFERSDGNAAAQLEEALREVHYREVQLPNIVEAFKDVDGEYGGFWFYYYIIGKEIGISTAAEGWKGYDVGQQMDLSTGQRVLYFGAGSAQAILTFAPAGTGVKAAFAGGAKAVLGRQAVASMAKSSVGWFASLNVTFGAGKFVGQTITRIAMRTTAAALNGKLGSAAAAAFNNTIGKRMLSATQGVLKGSLSGLDDAEVTMVNDLVAAGNTVQVIPKKSGIAKTADWFLNGVRTEFKVAKGTAEDTIKRSLQKAAHQIKGVGDEILIDARTLNVTPEFALSQIPRAAGNYPIVREVTVTILLKSGVVVRFGNGGIVWMPAAMAAAQGVPNPGR